MSDLLVRVNRTKEKLLNGESVVGLMVPVADERVIEWLGYTGLDYIVIEGEHTAISLADAERMARAAERVNLDTIIRLPDHDPDRIRRFLEVGVQGIMAPRVSSAEIAHQIVRAAKFHPVGTRGMGPSRGSGYGFELGTKEWLSHSNDQTLVVIQIEDKAGVEALPEIVKIEDIDVISMGPNDLSQSLGVPGELDHKSVTDAIARIEELATGAGKILNDSPLSDAHAKELAERGYRMLDYGLAGELVSSITAKVKGTREVLEK